MVDNNPVPNSNNNNYNNSNQNQSAKDNLPSGPALDPKVKKDVFTAQDTSSNVAAPAAPLAQATVKPKSVNKAVNEPSSFTDTSKDKPLASRPIEPTGVLKPAVSEVNKEVDKIDKEAALPSQTNKDKTAPPPWLNQKKTVPSGGGKVPPPENKDNTPASNSDSSLTKTLFAKIIPFIIGLFIMALIAFLVVKFLLPMIKKDSSNGGAKPSSSGKTVTLTYWGLWEPEEAMSEIIAEYQEENPSINIIYEQSSHKDYRERLQSALAQKKSNSTEGPDIFRYHNTWLPMLQDFLSPINNEVINIDDYFPVARKDLLQNNKIYGVPLMYDGLSLFYNTELLSNAGEQVPSSWEELQKTAISMTVLDNGNNIQTAGAALGTANNVDHFSDILALMMLQNNANLADPTDELASDALTFYTLFTTRDKVWDETLPNSVYAFATGKVAMIFAPSWRAFDISNINPELSFKTAPVPQLPDNELTWASYWVEGIAQSSKYKSQAVDFLAYLSKDETLRKMHSLQSNTRLFGEIYPKISLAKELLEDPIMGSFVNQAELATSWYMASETHDNGLNDKVIQYYTNAVNAVVNGEDDATSALATAAQGIGQILNTYSIAIK